MCRLNLLWGGLLIASGVGFLIGLWVNETFFAHLLGIGVIVLGVCFMRKR